MEKEKKKSIVTISVIVGILLVVFVILTILAIRNRTNATAHKVLRSEFARIIDKKEAVDCTISWETEDYLQYVKGGSIPNPKKQSITFAADKDWKKIYMSRYQTENTIKAFYVTEDKAYIWSPVSDLLKANELYQKEAELRRVDSVIITREEFNDQYFGLRKFINNMIPDLPAGTEIICRDGGTSGYSQPKDIKSWIDTTTEEK